MGVVFWGCEEVKEERIEAADVFLIGTGCLVDRASGRGVGLGVFPPITWAAVVATGFDVTVMSVASN